MLTLFDVKKDSQLFSVVKSLWVNLSEPGVELDKTRSSIQLSISLLSIIKSIVCSACRFVLGSIPKFNKTLAAALDIGVPILVFSVGEEEHEYESI